MPIELDETYQPPEQAPVTPPAAGGYVKLYRQSLYNGWLHNPILWVFWCWCLLKASHQGHVVTVGYQRVTLQPGQFVFGRKVAAAELKLSEKNIRTCVKRLKSANNLTIKTASKFSIITIVNWHTYQSRQGEKGQQAGQQSGQEGASKGPARGHVQEGFKNEKNEKKGESKPLALQGDTFLFFAWWGYAFQTLHNKRYRHSEADVQSVVELTELEPRLVYLIFRASSFLMSDYAYYKQAKTITRLLEVWNDAKITEPHPDNLRAKQLIPDEGEKLETWMRSLGVIQ